MPNARVVIEGTSNVVRVHVSGETLYNLEVTQQLTRSILGRLVQAAVPAFRSCSSRKSRSLR
jgi:hypothetical protein